MALRLREALGGNGGEVGEIEGWMVRDIGLPESRRTGNRDPR